MTQTNYHKDTKSASWLYKQHIANTAAHIIRKTQYTAAHHKNRTQKKANTLTGICL